MKIKDQGRSGMMCNMLFQKRGEGEQEAVGGGKYKGKGIHRAGRVRSREEHGPAADIAKTRYKEGS